jgi:hypothetical protein
LAMPLEPVRAERDRLRGELDQAPCDRTRELERATARREQADQALAAARHQHPDRRDPVGMLRRWREGPPAERRGVLALAEQQADRAALGLERVGALADTSRVRFRLAT